MRRARDCGLVVVTAESCTAGLVAHALSKGEGASRHFAGGFITYTKAMKNRILGVPLQLLQEQGAVCAAVAEAMAQGAIERSGASVGVAVTGVAGPAPDEDGNPVGLIYCGVARKAQAPRSVRFQSASAKRHTILEEAATEALTLLRSACVA